MQQDTSRLIAAAERCFSEASNALLKLTAYNALARTSFSYTEMSFLVIAHHALRNDMVAHALRVMDEHADAASFWYLHRCLPKVAERALLNVGVTVEALRTISRKLRHIREKTHFHIDRTAVVAPAQVWKSASLTGKQFKQALRSAQAVASAVHARALGGVSLEPTLYDGRDVRVLVAAAKAHRSAV